MRPNHSLNRTHYKHIAEVRVFSRSSFVPVQLRSIYLGCLMPATRNKLVRQLVERINPELDVIEISRDDLYRGLDTGVV